MRAFTRRALCALRTALAPWVRSLCLHRLRYVFPGLLATLAPCASAQVLPEQEILVRRVVPRNYHDPGVESGAISRVLSESMQRPVVVKPGNTLSGILNHEYRVSPSWTPEVYGSFEQHVRQLNGIQDPSRDLKPGTVLMVPDMPRGAESPLRGDARPVTQSPITFGGSQRNFQLLGAPKPIHQAVSNLAPAEVQIRTMTASQFAALKVDPRATREQLEAQWQFVPLAGHIVVALANEGQAGAPLTQKDRKALGDLLMRQPTTKPYVVVLDDSWPSQEDFRRSAEFVIQASRLIRSAYSLHDPAKSDSADIKTLEAEVKFGTDFCDADCEYPRLKWHAAMVRQSIEELRSLDRNNVVEVIYLPLNRAQRYSRNVLAEMMRVSLLADSVTSQLVLTTPSGRYPPGVVPGKPDHAGVNDLVTRMLAPAYLGTMPAAHSPGATLRVSTDKAIVDAVVNFMVLYSAASRRPHFISMSWTTPMNTFPALFRSDAYGMWLAAAGNDPNVDVHAEGSLFAARSSLPGDFIAVQNTASAGCGSSKLSGNPNVRVYGVAFPGRIDSVHCGTSFSTPRVAWLLAAKEAVKGVPVVPAKDESWTLWKPMKMESLFRMTKPGNPGEARYSMDMWQLLDEKPPQ